MGKVNENREFERRAPQAYYDSCAILELDNRIMCPFRLEYRVSKTNSDEFSSYLQLILVPTLGVSDYRLRTIEHTKYVQYYITLNAEEKDMELINKFLSRLCQGIKNCSAGIM